MTSFALILLALSTTLVGPDGNRVVPVPATKAPAAHPSHLHPRPPAPVPPEKLQAVIDRGMAFLLTDQNKDGSWGTPGRTKRLNIIAGVGSHQAFRTAVTALCVSALIESGNSSTPVRQAIERGEAFLFRELPRVRRDNEMLIYNIWAHGYGIQALVHMYNRVPGDKARRNKIVALIRGQYDRLHRYESAEGGWGYYDFDVGSQRPAASSTSFMDAAVLEAMYEARQIGVPPPPKLLKHALAALEIQRKPDFSYLYGTYTWKKPMWGINRPGGSLGRSQACNLALRLWGDKRVTDQVLTTWLDRLISRNGWLSLGRKRPIPHESFFMVAGYFYYFGHYYAGLCVEQLPSAERPFYQDHLAHILMHLQEKDGSWWDFPLYNYHQQYGTAFALMTLYRCRHVPATHRAAAQ